MRWLLNVGEWFCFLVTWYLVKMDDIISGISKNLAIVDEEELNIVQVDDPKEIASGRYWLVGKLLTNKSYCFEALRNTMKRIWLVKGEVIVFKWEDSDRILFSFESDEDRGRVLRGSPWTFDNALVLLAAFDGASNPNSVPLETQAFWIRVRGIKPEFVTPKLAERIGRQLGIFYPIGEKLQLEYEHLPYLCFFCGRLDHVSSGCVLHKEGVIPDERFGRWKTLAKNVFSIDPVCQEQGRRFGLIPKPKGWSISVSENELFDRVRTREDFENAHRGSGTEMEVDKLAEDAQVEPLAKRRRAGQTTVMEVDPGKSQLRDSRDLIEIDVRKLRDRFSGIKAFVVGQSQLGGVQEKSKESNSNLIINEEGNGLTDGRTFVGPINPGAQVSKVYPQIDKGTTLSHARDQFLKRVIGDEALVQAETSIPNSNLGNPDSNSPANVVGKNSEKGLFREVGSASDVRKKERGSGKRGGAQKGCRGHGQVSSLLDKGKAISTAEEKEMAKGTEVGKGDKARRGRKGFVVGGRSRSKATKSSSSAKSVSVSDVAHGKTVMGSVGKVGRSSGGLAMFWRKGLAVRPLGSSMGHIDVEVQLDLGLVRISGFYGNPETSNRWASWELLRRIAASVEGPWITFGDFNELRDASEKKGGSDRIESQMQNFVEAIDDCGLQDVEVSGPLFTWRRGDLLERLDMSLINQEAVEMFPRIHELHIDVGASDHIPILIYTDGLPAKKCDKRGAQGVKENLLSVAQSQVRWSRDTIGNISRQINRMTSELQSLPFDSTNSEVVERRISVVAELQKLMEYEEQMWRQKSRIDWLSEGDQNTKFFHGYAKARGRRNRVGRIMNAAGEWQETSEGIKEAFISYFQNIFASQGCNHMELVLDAIPQKISDAMNNRLCQPYGRGEIEQALKQMAPDKAPGEDGFSARFSKSTGRWWEMMSVENPQQVPDFRPISLCNVIYKLISKAIVNRLKGVLPDVISQFQSAFVPSRCIHDNVITAFELVHSIKTRQTGDQPHCVLKLDISKAYDRVEWVFLQGVLTKFGFDEKLVELIMRCVRSVSLSILWNGEAVGLINPTRGLRQGDPLSPYLFLMVSEGLTGLLQKADREGMIHGVKAAVDAPIISHLLFADDSLIFGRAEIHEAIRVKQCLLLYESAAGQKINFQKSAIAFGPGLDDQTKLEITQMLGVPMVDCHERDGSRSYFLKLENLCW
ncbi:hypothetical protein ACLB2K_035748 [Fragaria x ananassa]